MATQSLFRVCQYLSSAPVYHTSPQKSNRVVSTRHTPPQYTLCEHPRTCSHLFFRTDARFLHRQNGSMIGHALNHATPETPTHSPLSPVTPATLTHSSIIVNHPGTATVSHRVISGSRPDHQTTDTRRMYSRTANGITHQNMIAQATAWITTMAQITNCFGVNLPIRSPRFFDKVFKLERE